MGSEPVAPPDVDALIAELRARVDERRRDGTYPPGLEDDLARHFEVMLTRGMRPPRPVDLHGALGRIAAALPLEAARIPTHSRRPAGSALHQAVAKVVGRQTAGALQQVQEFAQPVAEALGALTTVFEDLAREVRDDLSARLDAVLERQAAYERWMVQAGHQPAATFSVAVGVPPPASPAPTAEESRARRRALADVVAADAAGPVLDFGPRGGDGDGDEGGAELLKVLADADDGTLGGVVVVQVVESMSTRDVVTMAALAAAKLQPGGRLLLDTTGPRAVFGDAPGPDLDVIRPLHPAYLTFLLTQAGFGLTTIDWRDPGSGGGDPLATGAAELKVRLYTPRDYLLTAVR